MELRVPSTWVSMNLAPGPMHGHEYVELVRSAEQNFSTGLAKISLSSALDSAPDRFYRFNRTPNALKQLNSSNCRAWRRGAWLL